MLLRRDVIDGHTALGFACEYSWEGQTLSAWVHAVLVDGTVWELNLVAERSVFEERRSQLERVVRSVKIGAP